MHSIVDGSLVVFVLVIMMTIQPLPSAFAFGIDDVVSKWFWQDVKENFVGFFSSQWREEAIVKHIAENQMYAEILKAGGTENIDVIEARITQKQIVLQEITIDDETVFQKIDRKFMINEVINYIRDYQEMGQVKEIVDEFIELRQRNDADVPRDLVDLTNRANSLEIVKKYCLFIDANKIHKVEDPLTEIKKYCPVLNRVPDNLLKSTLGF